jgi:maltose alpha-D-glucosyltransferase/alpha-amylase
MSDGPQWYKDAIFYELRIRSFYDSNGDGVGDLRGLTEKLDYIHDLGVTTIWVLPFYPSPLRDDGYDISDYTTVAPEYGTLRDFRTLIREAHRRDLKVVTELVVNHTSDQHAWFQRARRAPAGSPERDFYVWNDTPHRYEDARIIFKDYEHSNWAWDPVARAYYWHRFYANQPDLNFDNPAVKKAVLESLDQWMEMGVDGVRLDAVPYLYEREGTSCENLPETHDFLRELRAHVDAKFDNRMLLAEANQWPEDAVSYFGGGDECHMAFHFPIMPRLFMAIQMEDRYPILDILDQTPQIPESCQWALFLRNHDELTLEMVTDEERDYMWRVYARDTQARINLGIRRRLAPLLGNSRDKVELMNALLFSLPGTPVLYYGDEIGMGDNVYLGDRNGVRTPMQWTPDRNAGFSRANPQQLILPVVVDPEYHYEAVNVETQQANRNSLLWWTKRIVALRKQHRAFGRGTLEPLAPANRKVLAFLRSYGEEKILVVANLSRFSQYVELDLRQFEGCHPVELFGHIEFPRIGELPYLLTLGPYAFYWFEISREKTEQETIQVAGEERALPVVEVEKEWTDLLRGDAVGQLERILPDYVTSQRWFRSKARRLKLVRVVDAFPLSAGGKPFLVLADVEYLEGDAERYALLLTFVSGENTGREAIAVVRRRVDPDAAPGTLIDASGEAQCGALLLDLILRRRRVHGRTHEIGGVPSRMFRSLRRQLPASSQARILGAEQSNTSWIVDEHLVGKLFRRLEDGINPEVEIGRHLTDVVGFTATPQLAGHLEVTGSHGGEAAALAIFQAFVPNEGDAWRYTLDELARYFEGLLPVEQAGPIPPPPGKLLERARTAPPDAIVQHAGAYLDMVRLLGRRTAEMHAALATDAADPAFEPENFTPFSRRSLYQSLRNLSSRVIDAVGETLPKLAEREASLARTLVDHERDVLERFRRIVDRPVFARRIRCHGDYHLGQVLYTGKDFIVIDFEGEPARPLSERRLKRSPLIDVAGMIRSFDYAVATVLAGAGEGSALRHEDAVQLESWGKLWYAWVSGGFLGSYLEHAEPAGLLPRDEAELALLLDVYLLEKGMYEVGYEMNNRPQWVAIPLGGILDLLGIPSSPA